MIRPPPRSPLFPSTPLSRSLSRRYRRPRSRPHARHRASRRTCTRRRRPLRPSRQGLQHWRQRPRAAPSQRLDRKSTRLNSSHLVISYAVFCLKKKKKVRTDTNSPKTIVIDRKESPRPTNNTTKPVTI